MKKIILTVAGVMLALSAEAQVGRINIPQQVGPSTGNQTQRAVVPLPDQYLGFDLNKKLVSRTASYLLYATGAQVLTPGTTAETDGATKSVAAKTLSVNGKALRFRVFGTTGATNNNKTVQIYWGGTSVFTTGAVAANNKPWFLEATIIRTSAGAQTIVVQGQFNAGPVAAVTTATKDETTALVVKNTMTNGTGNAGDVITSAATLEVLQ